MRSRLAIIAIPALMALGLAACGDDDLVSDGGGSEVPATSDSAAQDAGTTERGFVSVGDETIALDDARCFLQEQEAAAGGGSILATAQGFGTDASGANVVIDFTRYNEESQFTGDDITVDIGDAGYSAALELGTVSISGSTVGADGFSFDDFANATQVPGAFEINC